MNQSDPTVSTFSQFITNNRDTGISCLSFYMVLTFLSSFYMVTLWQHENSVKLPTIPISLPKTAWSAGFHLCLRTLSQSQTNFHILIHSLKEGLWIARKLPKNVLLGILLSFSPVTFPNETSCYFFFYWIFKIKQLRNSKDCANACADDKACWLWIIFLKTGMHSLLYNIFWSWEKKHLL